MVVVVGVYTACSLFMITAGFSCMSSVSNSSKKG
jgi:hypothetical protein